MYVYVHMNTYTVYTQPKKGWCFQLAFFHGWCLTFSHEASWRWILNGRIFQHIQLKKTSLIILHS